MHHAHHDISTPDRGPTSPVAPDSPDVSASHEELIEAIRAEVDRLSELDPADVVEPAAGVAEMLGRLLEEVER